jgi:tryptophan synthase alpha chain
MTSFNILFSYGLDKFAKDATSAGVDGLILPDLPLEEAGTIKKNGLDLIFLVAPNSTDERINLASKRSTGFIYVLSITGITGARKELPMDIRDVIAKLRKQAKTPIAVGFGISNPDQAAEASRSADGVIVGSAVIDVIAKKPKQVGKFVSSLKKAIS